MIQRYRIFPHSGTWSWSWSVGCSSCLGPLHVQSEEGSQGWILITRVILLLIFSCLLLLQVGWPNMFTILVKSTAAISVWLCLLPPSQGRQRCLFPAASRALLAAHSREIHPSLYPTCWVPLVPQLESQFCASQNKNWTWVPWVCGLVGSNGWESQRGPHMEGNRGAVSSCRCSSVLDLAPQGGDGANCELFSE